MRFLYTLFVVILLVCFAHSCTDDKIHQPVIEEKIEVGETITLKNADLYQVLDSFSKLNLSSSTKCIPTIGYLKIIEVKGNKEMKLLIQSYEINSSYLKKLPFSEVIKVNNYRFFIDQNMSHYFDKNGIEKNIRQVIGKELDQAANKIGCGSEFTWLVHFSGKSIDTISYRATSPFGVACLGCDEWGDVSRMFVKTKDSDSLKRIEF